MMEEYQNDVWDIVTKEESKSMVSSKWTCNTKHVVDGRKYLWLEDSLRERELIMKRQLLRETRYTSIKTIMALDSMMYPRWMQIQSFLNGVIEKEVYF